MVATTPRTSTSRMGSGADMAGDDDLMDLADAVGVSRADGSHENFLRCPEVRAAITDWLYLLWNLSGDHR